MINTVLLDFGDTLVSERIFVSSGRAAMFRFLQRYYDWKQTDEWFQRCFHSSEAGFWARWGYRPPAVKEEAIRLGAIEATIRAAGCEPTREAVEGALEALVIGAGTSDCLLEGAREVVQELSLHYRLAIVSNGLDAYTHLCLHHWDLMRYFAVYTISEKANVEKPDPIIIALTLERLGVSAEQAVMVGNRADADVLCANRAGCRSVWFRHPGAPEHPEARPDAVINSLFQLPASLSQFLPR